MFIPVKLPPGLYRNGTDLDAAGRWRDGNLVRWRDDSLRPVGGWATRIEDFGSEPVRSMHSWQDNSGSRWIVGGSANGLVVSTAAGAISDITPVGLATGLPSATILDGFGAGPYGGGLYGTPRIGLSNFTEATSWSLDNFGELLIASSVADGKIYEWGLDTSSAATVIAAAPTQCLGAVVTEERFLFALGAGANPRRVQWCDREDLDTWTPEATNEAGDFELQTNGQIMAGVRARGQALILTNIDAHTATYIGPPFVYGFERAGTACGVVSRSAVAVVDEGVFWMGPRGFFAFSGSSVTELKCDVFDYVFGSLNRSQISKAWAQRNSQFGEIWWFYPSESSNEIDRYVVFNYKTGWWTTGNLSRTSGLDRGVFSNPMMIDTQNTLYDHETGLLEAGLAYCETGPISLGVGDQGMTVNNLIPDEGMEGSVRAVFKTRHYPNTAEYSYGPYAMDAPTSVRFTGRQVRLRVEAATVSSWRVGTFRLDAQVRGKR
jgi:hypothetical protein